MHACVNDTLNLLNNICSCLRTMFWHSMANTYKQYYGLDMPQGSQEHTLSKEVLRETCYDLEMLEKMVQLNEP